MGPEHRPKPSLRIVRAVKQWQWCPSAAGTFGGSTGHWQIGEQGVLESVHASL